MPRDLHPELLDCLERANPRIEHRVELSVPDVEHVLRLREEFLEAPTLVSLTPANSIAVDAGGALILAPTSAQLANFPNTGSTERLAGITVSDPARFRHGVEWSLSDSGFRRATLRSIAVRISRPANALNTFYEARAKFELQIYRVTKVKGVKQSGIGSPQYTAVPHTEYGFVPLLNPPPVVAANSLSTPWSSNNAAHTFDLSNWRVVIENGPDEGFGNPVYLIELRVIDGPNLAATLATGVAYDWRVDTSTSKTVSGVGLFDRVRWTRESEDKEWQRTAFSGVPSVTLNIDVYAPLATAVYALNVGASPIIDALGRVVFLVANPDDPGNVATIEISATSATAGFVAAKDGDRIVEDLGLPRQQTYWVRVVLVSGSGQRSTPRVSAVGVEWRVPQDVSVESVIDFPSRSIDLPWPKANTPEGNLRVLRTGVRDFLDVGGVIASTKPSSKLEADIFLASRHPSITREKWSRLERLLVSNRTPETLAEGFTLLSYASRLNREIPEKIETINTVHTVQAGSTAAQLIVSPGLVGTEYDGLGYYMRIRVSSASSMPAGFVAPIQGSTGTDRLDFTPSLPEALAAGDVIEVHSGIYATDPVSWIDEDPADVWHEVLTTYLAIPSNRIGLGSVPRGGLPPKVTEIAPGDSTTQDRLRVTCKLEGAERGDEILDQLSAIMGGATLEIDGQVVFVQVFPLRDPAGNVTVPLPAPAAHFDRRDYSSLQTPPGLEKRATVMSSGYGIPLTAADPDIFEKRTTTAVDSDALLWLSRQDLDEYGVSEVPEEISRWFYNSADQGLYLASSVTAARVRALSTGLRVFPITLTRAQPRLLPGDVVVVATDQYTDYDPSTETPLKGWLEITGVLVAVANGGRSLAMFVPGLSENVKRIEGRKEGRDRGFQPVPESQIPQPPSIPIVTAAFDQNGVATLHLRGVSNTRSFRVAHSQNAGIPAESEVAGSPYINAVNGEASYVIGSAIRNLLEWSEQFENPVWNLVEVGGGSLPVVTVDAAAAPDATTTADKVVFAAPASGDVSFIGQLKPVVNGEVYTGSIYVKAFAAGDEGKVLVFRHVEFATYSTVTLTNSWQRLVTTATSGVSTGNFHIGLRPEFGSSTGTVSALLWGAQLEEGSSATTYVPTMTEAFNVGDFLYWRVRAYSLQDGVGLESPTDAVGALERPQTTPRINAGSFSPWVPQSWESSGAPVLSGPIMGGGILGSPAVASADVTPMLPRSATVRGIRCHYNRGPQTAPGTGVARAIAFTLRRVSDVGVSTAVFTKYTGASSSDTIYGWLTDEHLVIEAGETGTVSSGESWYLDVGLENISFLWMEIDYTVSTAALIPGGGIIVNNIDQSVTNVEGGQFVLDANGIYTLAVPD